MSQGRNMKKKPFTKEEIRKIRKALENRKDGARDLALFNVQVDTMLRTSDLRNLTVHDVQSSETGEIKEQISVTMKKTGNTVACVLDQAAKEALHQWITTSGKSSHDYLFTGRKNPNKPITDTHHRHLLKNWCKAAGVTAETKATHSIRKTKATIIYKETQNVEAVRKLLGHRSIAATSAYLGVEDSEALALALKTRI